MRTSSQHGFRFSVLDGGVLVVGAVLAWWLCDQGFPLWWIVPVVLFHFFLFCNVFLVWRRWELIWAAVFVVNVAVHLALGRWEAASPLLFQLPVTSAILWRQIRSPLYHGIFAEQWNPNWASHPDPRS